MLTEINNVLSASDLGHIRTLIDNASWTSGNVSAGILATRQKSNEEMDQRCESWKEINQLVVSKLYQHPEFQSTVLPHRVSAAFVSRYRAGMAYKTHVDDPVMGTAAGRYRSDVSVTVFLSNTESYSGGELVIHSRFGPAHIKLPAGSAVVYPSSSLHEVTEISDGERLACVLWAQSMVRDAHQREILTDLNDARQALNLSASDAKVTQLVDQTYMNLVRLWSEV